MAQAVAPAPGAFSWTLRLYDAIPLSPSGVGVVLATALYALFLAVEAAIGRTPIILDGDLFSHSGEALITLLMCVMLAYLSTVTVSAVREGPLAVRRVRHLLEGSEGELDALELAAGDRPRRTLVVAGCVSVVIAVLVPYLETGQEGWSPYDWQRWTPESTWHRALTPLLGWWTGRLVAVMLIDSHRHSGMARKIGSIDLLDLRALVPFARLGLSNALRVVGIAAIFSFFLIDLSRYGTMVLAMAAITVAAATLALVLPVRGVHLRIRAAKLDELERVNRAIRGDAQALRGSALAERQAAPSLADLVAYRGLVESAREWPFDASTFRRFGLYLSIPLGSWMGAALVERLLDSLLE